MLENLTATVIAELAFKKFLGGSLEEVGRQFSTTAISKMDQLRQIIWNRLRGNHKVESALTALENGNKEELNRVSSYLQVEMDKDEDFCQQVTQLAQEIHSLKIQDNSNMTQINRDNSTGYQTKVEGGTAFIGGTHHHGNSQITQHHEGEGDNIAGNKIINNYLNQI